MSGVLYVVATPIGNLDDWTRRACRVLEEADLLLAEDTRHTRKLLNRYGLRLPVESYHDFNEAGRAASIVEKLSSGFKVALVSDQGTPGISDPGYRLVRLCRDRHIPVVPVPGPNAAIAALSVSGLPTDQFHFVGFLPSRKEARRRRFSDLKRVRATLILYEAPHRVRACLQDLSDVLGDRTVFLAREMTKLHEEYLFGPASDVLKHLKPKGEMVIIVSGADEGEDTQMPDMELGRISRQDLVKLIARRLGVGRRALYEALYKK